MKARRALVGLVALLIAGTIAGCGGGAGADSGSGKPSGPVSVFAAASLTESFTALGGSFEKAHPGVTVNLNFAGSAQLATQINQGAPADVFASAAPANMKTVTDAGNAAGTPTTFVRNQLVIAVPKGNPQHITGLADLAKPGVKVALCAKQVPCGAAAAKALAAGSVRLTPATLEQDVKSALSKVTLGEVDAALVYRTDVRAAGDEVTGVEFPESKSAINGYPIVVLRHAPHRALARRFIAYVKSAKGRSVLTRAGFQAP